MNYSYKPLRKLSHNREVEVTIGVPGFKPSKFWRLSTRQEGLKQFNSLIELLKKDGWQVIDSVAGHGYMQSILRFGISYTYVAYNIVER